jgi:chromosome partitioning protein
MPTHYCVPRAEGNSLDADEAKEFASFAVAVSAVEHNHDVVVINTPGPDTYLMRLAHSMAHTLARRSTTHSSTSTCSARVPSSRI